MTDRRAGDTPGATVLLIAPSAYHRIAFRQHQKRRIIKLGTLEFLCGLLALAVAMTGAVLLVTDFIFQTPTAIVATVGVGSLFAWLWFGLGCGGGRTNERPCVDPRHRRHARRLQLVAAVRR